MLSKIGIINLIPKSPDVSNLMRKEFKIFLGNPNLYFTLSQEKSIGTIREAFMVHHLKKLITIQNEIDCQIYLPSKGDLTFKDYNQQYIFEVGGRNKTNQQIKDISNSFIVADNILIGEGNKIPMWLFGLLKQA